MNELYFNNVMNDMTGAKYSLPLNVLGDGFDEIVLMWQDVQCPCRLSGKDKIEMTN